MDKLEPIIRHRFWVLLGLCLPLIIYGYMSASGAMQKATEDREGALEAVYSGVPGDSRLPNETYAEGLSRINDDFDLEVAMAHHQILDEQGREMDWPRNLESYVPGEYRGEFPRDAGFIFVDEYESLLEAVWQIAEPIIEDGTGFTGKVSFPYDVLPRHEFREDELTVSSERMWNAQEDIWLLRLLMEAVRDVNEGTENIAKARLRMINTLELMGGDGQSGGTSTAIGGFSSGGTGASGMEAMMSEMEDSYDDFEEEGMDLEGFGMGGGAKSSVAFDPEEEFGNAVATATVAVSAPSDDGAIGYRPGAGASSREEVRYIELDESLPYRERGFYMSVLINQRNIADFLIRLSNSRWPIRIVRFHVGPNPQGGTTAPSAGQSGYNLSGLDGFDSYDSYGGEFDMDSYEDDFDEYGDGGGMSSAYGDFSDYGPRQNLVSGSALQGAFSHPDLVQLEVLGAITIFNPLPEDVLAKVTSALQGTAAVPDMPASAPGDDLSAETPSPTAGPQPAVEDETSNQPAAGDTTDSGTAETTDDPSS